MNSLVQFWSAWDESVFPYVHPDDKSTFEDVQYCQEASYIKLVEDIRFPHYADATFHLGLLPSPYLGDLDHAAVYLLFQNPGFAVGDYYAEGLHEIRTSEIATIRQQSQEFPNPWLNPRYLWTPGGQYWWKKLRAIVQYVMSEMQLSHRDALKFVSRTVAILEWMPYHSKTLRIAATRAHSLVSPQKARHFVLNEVLPRVQQDEACIIVARHVPEWGIPAGKNVCRYSKPLRQTASLNLGSPGWKLITTFLQQAAR